MSIRPSCARRETIVTIGEVFVRMWKASLRGAEGSLDDWRSRCDLAGVIEILSLGEDPGGQNLSVAAGGSAGSPRRLKDRLLVATGRGAADRNAQLTREDRVAAATPREGEYLVLKARTPGLGSWQLVLRAV